MTTTMMATSRTKKIEKLYFVLLFFLMMGEGEEDIVRLILGIIVILIVDLIAVGDAARTDEF